MKGQAERLGRAGSRRRGPVPERDDRVERGRPRRFGDDARRAFRVLEFQCESPVPPGVVEHMAAVTCKNHGQPELFRRLYKRPCLVAGRRRKQKQPHKKYEGWRMKSEG